jgi:iron complex outermembrane receptor protein
MKRYLMNCAALLVVTAPAVLCAAPAVAQQELQEVIVTARKRQESILNVPVIETAIPQQQLERLQIKDMKDVATLVPSLAFGDSILSIGTVVSIRGVGTTAFDAGVDQSVTLNIDGMPFGNGLALMSGMFDVGQVEVLKGPQSLFYGKSAPGGVISIRTADPTGTPEIIARAGYEFEARERRGELIVSGPLSDTLKGRLAGFYSRQDGFYKNIVTGPLPAKGGRLAPSRVPGQKNWMVRATLLWTPTSQFDARLKLNNVHDRQDDESAMQLANCPTGVGPVGAFQFLNPADDCKLDRKVSWIEMDPTFFPNAKDGGQGFIDTTQTYGTLEMNYRPRPDLTLTSATGVYLLHSHSDFEASASSWFGPATEATNGFRRREVTEEIRANSDFAGPFNFTLGGFLERGRISDEIGVYGNTALVFPAILQIGTNIVHIKSDSIFGQARYKITPALELAAGVRWTDETRSLTPILTYQAGVPASRLGIQPKPRPKINSKKLSPEITLTYKPSDDVTLFGNYKRGNKSGSYAIGSPPVANVDNSFGDEKVEGGEVGLKSRLMGRALQFNLAGYYYKYSGLQVGAIIPVNNGIPVTAVVNAGAATVKGLEAEISYRPPQVENLGLHLNVNWNKARYDKLTNVPCYQGQTIAAGCNLLFSSAVNGGLGGFTGQDDSGLPMVRAPKLAANFGFDWETPIGQDMKLIIANSNSYSSRYLANLGKPFYQKAFIKADLSLTLEGPRDRWEVALIGKNLNNSLTTGNCINFNGRGSQVPNTQFAGTNDPGPAGPATIGCIMDRGREVWIRVAFKPLN